MSRHNNWNLDVKIGVKKCKVRKRGGCSSSSSSSLARNYRLKRTFLVGKRVGSNTPVPLWKMMINSKSPSLGNDKARESSVSARRLAATLWEINGISSPRMKKRGTFEGKVSKAENARKEKRIVEELFDLLHTPVSGRMDPPKVGSHRRRDSAGSQKLLQSDSNLGGAKSLHSCLVEVDPTQNHARSPCRHIVGTKNRLKDVFNSLITSKELLKVMSRISHTENLTSMSLFSALKFELDRACIHVSKLIQEQKANRSEIDLLLKKFEEDKVVWKLKEQDRIRGAVALELEMEKKLRRQTERLNKKLGRELAETKECLFKTSQEFESEKRAREILEQVCDELAKGIGQDRAEAEELKRESAKVREEVEKEREMLQLADVFREERVQMKLSEARYHFEEKNAIVEKMRCELEGYLKSKTGEEEKCDDGSPSLDKIKELEKYLRETLPNTCMYHADVRENVKNVNKEDVDVDVDVDDDDEEEEDEDDDDDEDNDLHCIELNVDDVNTNFEWRENMRNEAKGRSLSEKISKPIKETKFNDGIEWEFAPQPCKKETEDEMERYNMIKDLREHIVSGSRLGSSQTSKDPNGIACKG